MIFVDLDGVIADFDSHANATSKPLVNGERDWSSMGREWWASIPIFPGARAFVAELSTFGVVRFLSAVIMHPGCHSGKADWLVDFGMGDAGILRNLILCARSEKCLLAAPYKVLIDDHDHNIAEWQSAGGIGIQHNGDFACSIERVKAAIQA